MYCFQDEANGQRSEHFFAVRDAPKYDQVVEIDGRRLRRVIETQINAIGAIKPYVTYTLPKHLPGFKHNKQGRCVIETRAQELQYAKETGMEWE